MIFSGPLDVTECNKLVANAVKTEREKIIFEKQKKQNLDTMKK